MSLYLDTSCLVKLLQVEPETPQVRAIIYREPEVTISGLTELEAFQQLRAGWLGGKLTRKAYANLTEFLTLHRTTPPFSFVPMPASIVSAAYAHAKTGPYCRTLDRLHLAAMEALGIRRLLTNDDQQAAAARALGFGVVLPR